MSSGDEREEYRATGAGYGRERKGVGLRGVGSSLLQSEQLKVKRDLISVKRDLV
jgi:hypothetical protein